MLLLYTVYMHSWNKTVNMFCVLYLITVVHYVRQLVGVSPIPKTEWSAVVLNDWCIERISNKKCLHEP